VRRVVSVVVTTTALAELIAHDDLALKRRTVLVSPTRDLQPLAANTDLSVRSSTSLPFIRP
jgi:hypothetical protein